MGNVLLGPATIRVPADPNVVARELVINGKREEIFGKTQPYSFSIPESLVNQPIQDDQTEYFRKSPDGYFSIQVIASAESEDITNLAQQRLQVNAGEGYISSTLESIRNVRLGKSDWTRVRIDVKLTNGLKATEFCQATSDGTVFVFMHVINVPGEDFGYFQLANDTLDSFRIRDRQQ